MKENGKAKVSLVTFILMLIIMALICTCLILIIVKDGRLDKNDASKASASTEKTKVISKKTVEAKETKKNDNAITEGLSNFDLSFLKMENKKENKIYSPLSIKYALKMLEEGAEGQAKTQITNLIGKYNLTKYNSNSHMSLANAIFIKDTLKDEIKESYINILKEKYDAEVKFDSFTSVKNINTWISNRTLNLIDDMVQDIDENQQFFLINALAIDMDWNNKFLSTPDNNGWNYAHEDFYGHNTLEVTQHKFDNTKDVSGMRIEASINNYDIIKELGEENIRKTVSDAFRKYVNSQEETSWEISDWLNNDLSDENIEEVLKKYLDGGKIGEYYETNGYMEELSSNYGRVDYSTDFSIYLDRTVRAFAKDLKEYDGTTLQYIGIMPTSENLDSFIKNTDETKINKIISNVKELKKENFKQGVITKITGYIPKFDFEYELDLKQDLKNLGVTNIFEEGKANLKNITSDENVFIDTALHKANIEFTQDGIKAAAATIIGGAGAGEPFDYLFEVPVEEIDLTFDKPYMFIIRDKETGEIWFTGAVYEPLLWENEPEKDLDYRT